MLFNNVGAKIKIYAKVIAILSFCFTLFVAILSVCLAIATEEVFFLILLLLSPFIALGGVISSWFIYAYGDIYCNICKLTNTKENEEDPEFVPFKEY